MKKPFRVKALNDGRVLVNSKLVLSFGVTVTT